MRTDNTILPVGLFAFSNPKNDLDRLIIEQKNIRRIFDKAECCHLCEPEERPAADFSSIIHTFQNLKYLNRISIFHFGGHAGDYEMVLNDSIIKAQPFDIFLSEISSLKLIFLNGCSTKKQAQDLIKLGIPIVIATSQDVPDDSGVFFAEIFYNGLIEGFTIKDAFNQAENATKSKFSNCFENRQNLSDPLEPILEPQFLWLLYLENEDAGKWKLGSDSNDPYFGLPEAKHIPLPPEPYISLKSYTESESRIFWGRGWVIRDLFFRTQDNQSNPIILLYGQSGVGKSSILEAGLIPRLKLIRNVYYSKRLPGEDLIKTFKKLILSSEGEKLDQHVINNSKHQNQPCFIIDQFEESFTKPMHGYDTEFDEFCDFLKHYLKNISDQVKIILSYRKEYHAEIESGCRSINLPTTSLFVLPLERDNILEVVSGSNLLASTKRHYKIEIEKGLDEQIADDISRDLDSPIAPVLQILLTNLWKNSYDEASDSHRFTRERYLKLYEEGIALSDFIQDKIKEIRNWKAAIVDSGLLFDILYHHTTPLGTSASKDLNEFSLLYDDSTLIKDIINKCKEVYLLSDLKTSSVQVSLAHDTLAPIVRALFDKSTYPGQRANRILANLKLNYPQTDINKILLNENDLINVDKGLIGMQKTSLNEKLIIQKSRKHHINQKQRKKYITYLISACIILIFFLFGKNRINNLQKNNLSAQKYLVQGISQLASKNYNAAAISLDTALTFNDDWETRNNLVEALSNKCSVELSHKFEGKLITISPQGKIGIVLNYKKNIKKEYEIEIWNLQSKNKTYSFFSEDSLLKADINEQENLAVFGFFNGKIQIINMNNNSFLRNPPSHKRSITAIVFSQDSKNLAYSNGDGEIWVYNRQTQKEENVDKGKNMIQWALSFNHSGTHIASGGNDNKLRLYKFVKGTWKPQPVNSTHSDVIGCLAFSTDDKYIATGSTDATIGITSCTDGVLVKKFHGHLGTITSLEFNYNSKYLLSGSQDGCLKIWNFESSQRLFELSVYSNIRRVRFCNKSDFAFSTNSMFYKCSRNLNSILKVLHNDSSSTFTTISIDSDEKWLASGGINHNIDSNKATDFYIWDLTKNKMLKPIHAHSDDITGLAFNPEGDILASASSDEFIKFWNTENWSLIDSSNFEDEVTGITYNSFSQLIAVGNQGNKVKLDSSNSDPVPFSYIKLFNQNCKVKDSIEHIGASAFSLATTTKHLFATGGGDNTARLWDFASKKEVHRFLNHELSVWAIAISKNDSLLASGGIEGLIRIYDLNSHYLKDTLVGHLGGIFYLTFSPDGKWLASAGNDYTVRLWNLENKKKIILKSFNSPVWMIQFNKKGDKLYACGLEEDIRIFNIEEVMKIMTIDVMDLVNYLSTENKFFSADLSQ